MKRGRSWSIVAAMATVASLALGPLGAIDASAVTLQYNQQGGFSFGSALRTAGSITASGVEYSAPTGFIVTDAGSPNVGAATFGEIGWGCGSAVSSNPGGTCAIHGTVNPRSPVTGLPAGPPAGYPENFRSALDLDVFSGNVIVDGAFVPLSSLQHYNRTINQNSRFLSRVDIDTLLTLDTIPSSTSDTDPGFVRLGFNETINAGPCAPNTGSVPCPDIFSFEDAVFDPIIVTVGGVNYLLEFRFTFPVTTFDERTLLNVPNGATFCNADVCTAENAISEALIEFRVISLAVPAPASLLLLGFGLSGLGVAGWLRRS